MVLCYSKSHFLLFRDFLFNSLASSCVCLTLAFIYQGFVDFQIICKLNVLLRLESSPLLSPSSFSALSSVCSFWALSVCLLVCLMLSHRSLKLCLLQTFIPCSLHWMLSLASSRVTDVSIAIPNVLLSCSIECLFLVTVLQLEIFLCFFKIPILEIIYLSIVVYFNFSNTWFYLIL